MLKLVENPAHVRNSNTPPLGECLLEIRGAISWVEQAIKLGETDLLLEGRARLGIAIYQLKASRLQSKPSYVSRTLLGVSLLDLSIAESVLEKSSL